MHVQSCTELHQHAGVPAVLPQFSGRDELQPDGEGGLVQTKLLAIGLDG